MELIAHRGGRGFGTDNTLEAMREAVRAGVRAIEIDVRKTQDDRLVLCHDATIWGRIVSRTTYEELKKHAPDRPLLSDVLDSLAGWVRLDLDVKDSDERSVGEMLRDYNVERDTIVTSFHRLFLDNLKNNYPEIRTGFLYRMPYGQEKKLLGAVACGADTILPHFHSIDEDLVESAHGIGLKVYAWTVNSVEDFQRLRDWGVDGVVTDRYLELEQYVKTGDK